MTLAARDAAIKKFTEDPDCKIFLMSLKAGGVALNLTVASHVSVLFSYGGSILCLKLCYFDANNGVSHVNNIELFVQLI